MRKMMLRLSLAAALGAFWTVSTYSADADGCMTNWSNCEFYYVEGSGVFMKCSTSCRNIYDVFEF